MHVTRKCQVTIPKHIREKLGIPPNSEVDFLEEDGRVYLTKKVTEKVTEKATEKATEKVTKTSRENRFRRFRGVATIKMSTDEIMSLCRGIVY
jgi:AbrB family looped-hinge helix DNA binding protein